MGADGSNGLPPHKVMLSRSFYMGKYEVTQAQWAAVMGNNPSYFTGEQKASNVGKDIGNFFQKLGGGEEAKKDLKLDPNRPVERVSWNEVQDFIKRLNEREGQGKYRLPTEAEWEYAARAGSSTSAGNGPLEQYAWCAQNAASTTHAVGQLKPNAWGLYDMFGNVWEWVQDWWGQYQKEMVTDPQGPQAGSLKIFRGGAWNQPPAACQPAHRYYDGPTFKHLAIGFRLVREVQ
jgi:formylglycine-generating enzyme required for sulfatase activity